MRAFNNLAWHRGNANDKIALTGFGPNINIARDPRFGRASELPGEDPTLNGKYAASMVQGMQQLDSAGHPKMIAYLKHYTAYSKEQNRGHDSYQISMCDPFPLLNIDPHQGFRVPKPVYISPKYRTDTNSKYRSTSRVEEP